MPKLTVRNKGAYIADVHLRVYPADIDITRVAPVDEVEAKLVVNQSAELHANDQVKEDLKLQIPNGTTRVVGERVTKYQWKLIANIEGSQLGGRESEYQVIWQEDVSPIEDFYITLTGTTCKPGFRVSHEVNGALFKKYVMRTLGIEEDV